MGDNAPPKPSPGLAPLWTPCDWKPANDEPESPARGQGGHVEESLPVGEPSPGWADAEGELVRELASSSLKGVVLC